MDPGYAMIMNGSVKYSGCVAARIGIRRNGFRESGDAFGAALLFCLPSEELRSRQFSDLNKAPSASTN